MSLSHSIYQEPWYLDAVAPGRWAQVTATAGDEVVGRLPYVIERKAGMAIVTQPPLVQTLGPAVRRRPGKSALGHEHAVLTELEAKLPPCDRFMQSFPPEAINAMAFHWAGYDLAVRYTYRLDLDAPDAMFSQMASRVRTEIRKAQQRLQVRESLDVERFYAVWRKSFERQGLAAPHSLEQIERLQSACVARQAGAVLHAEDEDGRVHAVNFFVWHAGVGHGMMSGADPELRRSGGQTLLLWEVLQRAAQVAEQFDFSGSMMPGVEPLFRDFGARQAQYLVVSRESRRLRILTTARELAREARGAGRELAAAQRKRAA